MTPLLYVTFNVTRAKSNARSWFFFFMFSRNGRCAGSAKENAPHGISI